MGVVTGGVVGTAFHGGTITQQTVFAAANKDTTPLQLKPVTGATADQTDQLEVYDDVGGLLAYLDAAGNALLSEPNGDTGLSVAAGASRNAALFGLAGTVRISSAYIAIALATGKMLRVNDHGGNAIFEVRDDGTVHILTGQSVVADL